MPMQMSPAEYYKDLVGSWKDQSIDYLVCHAPLERQNRKKVAKWTQTKASKPGERLYMDISSMKERSLGGSKFWALIVDDYSDYMGKIL